MERLYPAYTIVIYKRNTNDIIYWYFYLILCFRFKSFIVSEVKVQLKFVSKKLSSFLDRFD